MASMQDIKAIGKRKDDSGVASRVILAEIDNAAAQTPAFHTLEERYRQIAARCLDTSTGIARSQSVAVSSPTLGEGASSVAIGVAVAAARNLGSDVLLLEADMQHPQFARDFATDAVIGLSDYLSSDIPLESVIKETRAAKVFLLPAGRRTPNPGPLIRSDKFRDLLKQLHGVFPTIIIDTPPLLTSPHAAVIANHADSVVLVVRSGHTHAHDAAKALKSVKDTPVRGVVLNRTRQWAPDWVMRLLGVSRFDID
jgi:capsular exopolysaccharide synthesis family protein